MASPKGKIASPKETINSPNEVFAEIFGALDSEQIFYAVIGSYILKNIIEIYIMLRQITFLKKLERVPRQLKLHVTQDNLCKDKCHLLDIMRFEVFRKISLSIVLMPLEVHYGLLPFCWILAEELAYLYSIPKSESVVAWFFVMLVSVYCFAKELPFTVYRAFVLKPKQEKDRKLLVFAFDIIKSFCFVAVCGPIFSGVAVALLERFGDDLFIWLWACAAVLVLAWQTLIPALCVQLYEPFKPLTHVALTADIMEMTSRLSAPVKGIYVLTRTNWFIHDFAMYYGLFNSKYIALHKRIVPLKSDIQHYSMGIKNINQPNLWLTRAETLAVLIHHLGHWKLGHNFKNLIVKQLSLGVFFTVFYNFFKHLDYYAQLGFGAKHRPLIVALLTTYIYAMALVNAAIIFGIKAWYRRLEIKSDEFTNKSGHSPELASALVKIYARHSFAVNDWLYSAWYLSTPTLLERVQRLEKLAMKAIAAAKRRH